MRKRLQIYFFFIVFCLETKQEVITNPQHFDGFGSQFQTIIAAVCYAELHNKPFVYTPFKEMDHNYNYDPHFLEKKEQLINFIGNFELFDSNNHNANKISAKEFLDRNISRCANSSALENIKNIFRANKNIKSFFNNNYINIAIHMRKLNPHDGYLRSNTPDSFFLDIITKFRVLYESFPIKIHIYSQGNIKEFRKTFKGRDIVLHIDESIEDTFTGLVLADVLVTNKSCLSYTAALLSDGLVYYIPFCHNPLPHWIPIDTLLNE